MLLLVTGAGIAVSSLALWVTATSGIGGVWTVLVLFSVQTAFLAVNQPTRSAVLPRLLPAAELPAANALNMTVVQAGAIAGPLLAGVLIPVIGLPTLYLLDAIALLATLWATWRLPAVPAGAPPAPGAGPGFREVVDGFRYAAMHKVLLVSFLIDVVAMGFGMPRVVFPEMSHTVFGDPTGRRDGARAAVRGDPDRAWSSAGLFSGWLHRVRRQGVAVTVAICVWGLGVALFGLTDSLWLAVLALAVAGAGRPGQLGVPVLDAADGGHRRDARPDAGRVHRGGGRRAAAGRPLARAGRGRDRAGPGGHRRRGRGDRAGRRGGRGVPGVLALPGPGVRRRRVTSRFRSRFERVTAEPDQVAPSYP